MVGCARNAEPPAEQCLDSKIRRWVTASGREIEMATAQAARKAGALAIQSVPYIDPLTGKDRETDVLAEFDGREGRRCL
jgi:hypothetical protein